MWTDIVSHENMDNRIWPRTAAIAERWWSPQEVQDVDSMYQRLAIVSQKLGCYGLRHRRITEEMLERMSGEPDPEPLRVRSEEHTSELQSRLQLVCRLLLEKKKKTTTTSHTHVIDS